MAALLERPHVLDEESGIIRADTGALRLLVDGGSWADRTVPDAWGFGGITFDDLDHGPDRCDAHWRPTQSVWHDPCLGCELSRIRTLAATGWPSAYDDPHPITIDVGLGDYEPLWPVTDGNHRVAAALWRGDPTIDVVVVGDWDRAVRALTEPTYPVGVTR